MKRLLFAIVLLLLTPQIAVFAASSDQAKTYEYETVKNRLANIKDRLAALNQLQFTQDSAIINDLIHIVRDTEDSIVIRGHVVEWLISTNDSWVTLELKKLLRDSSLPSDTRRFVLYGVWKKDPSGSVPELIDIAQNPSEAVELRTASLSYLGQTPFKYSPDFWKNIFRKKENPVPVRIAVMHAMETLQILNQERLILTQVLQDSEEQIELRKSVILTSGRIFSPAEFEAEMIAIISKPENPLEIRYFALDNIGIYASKASLPQLKQILSHEKDHGLASELEALIANLTSKH